MSSSPQKEEAPLDDETERLIRECAVAHRRGFNTPSTSDYPRAFNALRQRIRTLLEEARKEGIEATVGKSYHELRGAK